MFYMGLSLFVAGLLCSIFLPSLIPNWLSPEKIIGLYLHQWIGIFSLIISAIGIEIAMIERCLGRARTFDGLAKNSRYDVLSITENDGIYYLLLLNKKGLDSKPILVEAPEKSHGFLNKYRGEKIILLTGDIPDEQYSFRSTGPKNH